MPVAKIQLADGRVARIEVPEGTTQEQVMQFIAQNEAQFSQAAPVEAAPVQQEPISPQVQAISGAFKDENSLLQFDQRFKQAKQGGLPDNEALRMAAQGTATGEEQRQVVAGLPSAALTLATGAIAEPLAGIAGGVTSLIPGLAPGSGAGVTEGVRKRLTAPPIGESGKAAVKQLGQVIDPTLGAIQRGAKSAGGFTTDVTGSPLAGTVVETGLTAIPDLLGLKGASSIAAAKRLAKGNRTLFDDATGLPSPPLEKALAKRDLDFGAIIGDGQNLPVIFGKKSPDQVVEAILKRKIETGDTSNALFNLKLGPGGKVVKDQLGDEALKQGYLKGDIASAKAAGMPTKVEMRKMLDMKRRIDADSSKALDFRPTDIVGNNAMERFNFVRDRANELRLDLDALAKGDIPAGRKLIGSDKGGQLKNLEIDPGRVADSYFSGLERLKVEFDTSTIPPKLDFKNSLISEDKTSQRVLKSVGNILAKEGKVDALKAHQLKRQLDTMLDFNKKSATGLTESGKKFAGEIRRALNDSIRDVSPRYAEINDKLSQSLKGMEDFDKALGGGTDAFASNANVAVGQTLRRLLSNATSKANLDTSLANLDDIATGLGGSFNTDLKKLINFNKTLDDRFGATARGSFQGEIESAIRSLNPAQVAKDLGIKKLAEKTEKLRGINNTNAFNVMSRILNEGS